MFNELLFAYCVVKFVAVVVCFAGGFGMCGSSTSCTWSWQLAEISVDSILI
jgi:hypothetical protein